jgi:hypothetical protein
MVPGLGVDQEHPGRADQQVITVGAAAWDGDVVQDTHVAAVIRERQRLCTSRDLADAHPNNRIEITPDKIVIVPKDGLGRASSRRADVVSLLADTTTRTAIASKRKLRLTPDREAQPGRSPTNADEATCSPQHRRPFRLGFRNGA